MSKKLNIFGTLLSEVVNKNLCSYCGTCIASCPVGVLQPTIEEKPTIKGVCALCQVCYYSCPRVELPLNEIEKKVFGRTRSMDERILGQSKAVYSVRSTDQSILKVCQDGGAVSSLLKHMLETQSVNCAVVTQTDMNEPLRPVPRIAAETTAVIAGAGTKYSCGAAVAAIAEAALGYPNGRIAFVGLPCEVQGLRRMGSSPMGNNKLAERVALTIGLFCSKSYYYKKLVDEFLQQKNHVEPRDVTRVAIKGNRFAVSAEEEILIEVPVAAIAEYQREGCRRCVDYTAELADISIGGVGSSLGWSTVVIRSDAGEKIFESARKARVFDCKDLKTVDPGMNTIMKLSEKKKKQDASTYLRYM